jgi:hypothetical protein
MIAMMVSLQRKIDQRTAGAKEQQFFSQSLIYLSSTSKSHFQPEDWMITSFEVEFQEEIGSGGLFVLIHLTCIFILLLSQIISQREGLQVWNYD